MKAGIYKIKLEKIDNPNTPDAGIAMFSIETRRG